MTIFTNPADAAADAAEAYVEAVLDMLGARDPMAVLDETPDAAAALIRDVPSDRLREPEAPGRWSVGEVLAHLADSELVWSARLRFVLGQDRPELTGYDQDEWARRLGYADLEPAESLDRFRRLRRWNLELLGPLPDSRLDRIGIHVERGEESVRHMLRLYAGHDLVHLAQIRRILGIEPAESDGGQRGHVRRAHDVPADEVGAGRATVRRVLIDATDAPNFALRKFTMQPGGGMPRHTNAVEHEQYVLRGRARIGIGDETFEVGADDVVYIPAGVPHWYEALDGEPFEFLCAVPNEPDRIDILDD